MKDKERLNQIREIYLKWYNSVEDNNNHSKKALYDIGELI